jgi:sugar O-acyltransferase (sialic acid O-acetyltransferase NeuD family)
MSLIIVGAGGHAKVVIESAERAGQKIAGVVDNRVGVTVFEYPFLGSLENMSFDQHSCLVIAIGANVVRAEIARSLESKVNWVSIVDTLARVSSRALIQAGSVALAGSVVQADAKVGQHVILNTSCTVDHDVEIGDYCHVGPGAVLTGGVVLEEGVFIGAGAVVLPGVRIGAWTTLGAGSVATRNLSSAQVYIGSPARLR